MTSENGFFNTLGEQLGDAFDRLYKQPDATLPSYSLATFDMGVIGEAAVIAAGRMNEALYQATPLAALTVAAISGLTHIVEQRRAISED